MSDECEVISDNSDCKPWELFRSPGIHAWVKVQQITTVVQPLQGLKPR